MRQNRSLVAVLLAGLVLAAGVVGVASLRAGEPGPEDVAIRVGTVEVTFGELEMHRVVNEATRPIHERFIAGEDFGMPPELFVQVARLSEILAPLRPDFDDEVAFIAWIASPAAARDAVAREGLEPSEEAIASRMAMMIQRDELIRTDPEPMLGFARALNEAHLAALGEARYLSDFLPLQARESLARERLSRHLELEPAEVGVVPLILSMRALSEADRLDPSLRVTPQEVRDYAEQEVRAQEAMLELQKAFPIELEP